MWGAFNPASGMGYETAFPWTSETVPWWRGFFYGDLLRIHTSTFYHLSYLLSVALHIQGSYVPYQIVYALLWWGRGILVFLILQRFLGDKTLVSYVAGALVIVHSSDGALQWVGQLNQFGFIFWMLLAFYLLTVAASASRLWTMLPLLIAACFFEQMSLFSYESQLLLILVYPAALLFLKPGWRRWCFITATWYVAPAAYLLLTVRRYLLSNGASYQESVMRTGWSALTLASDWWFNIASSLEFWAWKREANPISLLSVAAALVFIAGGMLWRANRPSVRTFWVLLSAGTVALILSFPVYLLLDSARGLWRTQFLSGIGTGLVWAALLGLIATKIKRPVAVLLLGSMIVYFGADSAIAKGAFHRAIWDRHRAAMVRILRAAPSVKPDTVIVLTGVPKNEDPFGHDLWFDYGIKLSYPGIPVAGTYYYSDGTPSPRNGPAPGTNRVVIDWSGKVVDDPASAITGSISPIAVHRYHP